MEELHPLGAVPDSKDALEKVSPQFLDAELLRARDKTWRVLGEIRSLVREGMTEDDGRKLAMKVFADSGVAKHWHKPYLRFGPGTALTFNDPLQADYRLRDGDPFYLDLGPIWPGDGGLGYEGDVGDTFVLGANKEADSCAAAARRVFDHGQRLWRERGLTGAEIYREMRAEAGRLNYDLADRVEGHRLGDFPHHRHTKGSLAAVPFVPSASLWVLEVQLNHRTLKLGAFFEDVLRRV